MILLKNTVLCQTFQRFFFVCFILFLEKKKKKEKRVHHANILLFRIWRRGFCFAFFFFKGNEISKPTLMYYMQWIIIARSCIQFRISIFLGFLLYKISFQFILSVHPFLYFCCSLESEKLLPEKRNCICISFFCLPSEVLHSKETHLPLQYL